MLKKTMTYTDYNGTKRTEDFYFDLSRAELMELELSVEGGIGSRIERIVASSSQTELIKTFKEIILMAYGKKSEDGRRMEKSPEIRAAFEQCPAYSDLFMELLSDEKTASNFLLAVVPSEVASKAEAKLPEIK